MKYEFAKKLAECDGHKEPSEVIEYIIKNEAYLFDENANRELKELFEDAKRLGIRIKQK